MTQASRESGSYENMISAETKARGRLKLAKAVDVLNKIIEGDDIPEQRARYSFAVVNKLLPNYQAVAIQIEDRTTANVLDIMNQAAALGISPDQLFSTPETNSLISQENSDSVSDDSEGGHPPDVDE